MIYRFPLRDVKDMLLNQISNNFFKSIDDEMIVSKHMPKALERFEETIDGVNNKYYFKINDNGEREAFFDPLHTCQWLLFLYLMANTIFKYEKEKVDAARVVCDKIYGQSKTISGCDLYYEVEMPVKFLFEHPTGSVMGRAKYGEYFYFNQGCTVENHNGKTPVIGSHVTMLSGSAVLGNSHVGDNCIICSDTVIIDEDIPVNSEVSGKSPRLVVKPI